MYKLIVVLILFSCTLNAQDDFEISLPDDAQSYIQKPYSIAAGQTLKEVLEGWVFEEYKTGALILNVGQYQSVPDIVFDSSLDFDLDFEKSVYSLLSRLNNESFVKDVNIVIYSCFYTNNVVSLFVRKNNNGGLLNACNG